MRHLHGVCSRSDTPRLSGDRDLHRDRGGGGVRGQKKVYVYPNSTSNLGFL